MLILQRKAGEAIHIGDDIVVRISDIGSDRVKVAIDAPRGIAIVREELLTAKETNIAAAAAPVDLSMIRQVLKQEDKKNEDVE
jgi:carbon storage regulator